MWYLSFCAWLISLNILTCCCISVIARFQPFLWLNNISHFLGSFIVDINLGCFHFEFLPIVYFRCLLINIYLLKNLYLGASVVAQRIKLPASLIGPHSNPVPCWMFLGKQQKITQVLGPPLLHGRPSNTTQGEKTLIHSDIYRYS